MLETFALYKNKYLIIFTKQLTFMKYFRIILKKDLNKNQLKNTNNNSNRAKNYLIYSLNLF